MNRKIHIYLISDSTGETVANISKSVMALFDDTAVINHHYPMFRKETQLEELREELLKKPGIVMGTIVNHQMNQKLIEMCEEMCILYIPVLDRVIAEISSYLNEPFSEHPGRQHELNEDYFSRINALSFTLAHDDGQSTKDLEEADIVLVGVSRSSKSPTSIYLANRGVKCANIPFVSGRELPSELYRLKNTLVVGLVVDIERLLEIRKSRLVTMNDKHNKNYIDYEEVFAETEDAKRLFKRMNWPIIDVTKRSIEESASIILRLLEKKCEE
jgi:regulator of PEP synthase PpsR (kinase-PPPase family)